MIVTPLSQFYQPTLGGLRIKGYFRGEDSTLAFFSLSVTSIRDAGQLCRIHFHDTFKTVHIAQNEGGTPTRMYHLSGCEFSTTAFDILLSKIIFRNFIDLVFLCCCLYARVTK